MNYYYDNYIKDEIIQKYLKKIKKIKKSLKISKKN